MGGQRLELVGRRDEREAGDVGNLGGHLLGEPDAGVQSGPNGRSAGGQQVESRERCLNSLDSCNEGAIVSRQTALFPLSIQ